MKIYKIVPLIMIFSSCAKLATGIDTNPTLSAEIAECVTSTSYSPSVTVTGAAFFFKRGLIVNSSGATVTSIVLGAPISTALPIKYAEIRVLNSSGTIVQCGQTDSSGTLKALDGTSSLSIPNVGGSYTVQVLSRTNHTVAVPGGKTAFKVYTSVKSDLYANTVYILSSTVASAGSGGSVSTSLTAYARESDSSIINGGAFNILNNIVTTYDYLAQNTSTSDLRCLNPKLDVYWKAGFNPAQYVYPDQNPSTLGTLSFYVRGDNQLFINGGRLGNVASQDTDHFDDTVIIHELGHHVEDVCGKMDSPGGTHYGLYRIDPRLSWSEGWGNYFGAHQVRNNIANINPDLSAQVTGSGGWLYYLDTDGYTDAGSSSGKEYIRIDLNTAGNNPKSIMTDYGTRYFDKVDASTNPGEGLFRETSISRSLFKITNNCSGCANTAFSYIWKAFENNTSGIGMGKSDYPFRSAARFYSRLNAAYSNSTPAAIDTILNSDEAQQRETNSVYVDAGSNRVAVPYGIKLVSGLTCLLKIQPRQDSGLNANFLSDQRFSNHFYYVALGSLAGVTEIRVSSTYVAGTTGIDVDAILYGESYNYDEDCTSFSSGTGACLASQKVSSSSSIVRADRTAGNGVKIISLAGLSAANNYLLNVRAYTAAKTTVLGTTEYSYTITNQSGASLCPANSY
ncbi:MAG: hypothetical protein H7256_13940 [Bdellovibrio sp.]|nr:hypothetical protein [Bdellovibrio sp.]